MTGSKILNLAYTLSNTDSSTFLDANSTNIYEHLNTLLGHRILDILRVRVDRNANIENATADLKAYASLSEGDSGYKGEYSFPTDLLKPSRVEISYDGKTWNKATVYDNATNRDSEYNDEQLESMGDKDRPVVDFARNSYKIRPLPTEDVTKGIYIEYEKRQDDFTSTTAPTDIESNLQDILAYDLAELEFIMHPENHDNKQITLFQQKKAMVERRFLEFYKNRLKSNLRTTYNYNFIR
jgi:hypothetical protein